MEYVLLVETPSEGWSVWAWADTDDEGGYLRTEQSKLVEMGHKAVIFLRMP